MPAPITAAGCLLRQQAALHPLGSVTDLTWQRPRPVFQLNADVQPHSCSVHVYVLYAESVSVPLCQIQREVLTEVGVADDGANGLAEEVDAEELAALERELGPAEFDPDAAKVDPDAGEVDLMARQDAPAEGSMLPGCVMFSNAFISGQHAKCAKFPVNRFQLLWKQSLSS